MQEADVPVSQLYGLTTSGINCVPNTLFHGNSVTIRLSEARAGDTYSVCAAFKDEDCIAMEALNLSGENRELYLTVGII